MQDAIDLQRKVYEVNRDNANRNNVKYLETSIETGWNESRQYEPRQLRD